MTGMTSPKSVYLAQNLRDLTPEEMEYVVCGVQEGKTLRELIAAKGITPNLLYENVNRYPEFDKRIRQARIIQSHFIADDIMHVTDNCRTIADASAANVKSKNMQWVASRFNVKDYGDQVNVQHNIQLDLGPTLLAAQNRVLSLEDTKKTIELKKTDRTNARSEAIDVELVSESNAIPAELEDMV